MDSRPVKKHRWDKQYIQEKRPSWDQIFVEFLYSLAKRSLCVKYKTSALVVKNTQILSMGYNGTFEKQVECEAYWNKQYEEFKSLCDDKTNLTLDKWLNSDAVRTAHREWSSSHEVHAEINALNWIPKGSIDPSYVLYTLYSPCDACAKEIISYGIKNVKYRYLYPNGSNALTRLQQNGVSCIRI